MENFVFEHTYDWLVKPAIESNAPVVEFEWERYPLGGYCAKGGSGRGRYMYHVEKYADGWRVRFYNNVAASRIPTLKEAKVVAATIETGRQMRIDERISRREAVCTA